MRTGIVGQCLAVGVVEVAGEAYGITARYTQDICGKGE